MVKKNQGWTDGEGAQNAELENKGLSFGDILKSFAGHRF